ncbi:MAG: N-6 DNA methylase [Acidimicrobiales bacterium]
MDPWTIAAAHEAAVAPEQQRRRGAWYTPRPVVEAIVELAVPSGARPPGWSLDPSCGGGAFLVGVLDRLVALGVPARDALDRVAGTDIDAGAVAATNAAVAAWAAHHGCEARSVARLGDALSAGAPASPVDLIVGNPPFATPLRGAPLPAPAAELAAAQPERFGPYADLAAIHLAAAWGALAPGGRLAMVVPQSLLNSRDTAGLRRELEPHTVAAWASRDRHFAANVRVWAPVLRRDASTSPEHHPPVEWSDRVGDALGVPAVPALGPDAGVLGDLAEATSGFRDEYYALARACREASGASDELPLCTVGSLDPLDLLWGRRPTKLAKVSWQRPVVALDDLDERREWVDRLCRPKVLLPTQSKVLEPVVDPEGRLVPVTPVLAVWPRGDATIQGTTFGVADLAAVLLAPPVSAWALRRGLGTALSVDAIKLAARDVLRIPLPRHREPWRRAAELVADGPDALDEIGHLMTEAYGPTDRPAEGATDNRSLTSWWADRRPRR